MYVRAAQWREQKLTSGRVLRNFGTPTSSVRPPTIGMNPMGEFQERWRTANQAQASEWRAGGE